MDMMDGVHVAKSFPPGGPVAWGSGCETVHCGHMLTSCDVEQVHGFPANGSSHLALLVVSGPGPNMRYLSVPLAAGFDHHHLSHAPHDIMWARYPPCVPSVSSGHHAFSSPPARGQIDLPGAACLPHIITVEVHEHCSLPLSRPRRHTHDGYHMAQAQPAHDGGGDSDGDGTR